MVEGEIIVNRVIYIYATRLFEYYIVGKKLFQNCYISRSITRHCTL